ncbi:MAG: hypothetical protein E7434_06085 [Ruminococcaceae bacterium]|nr:hypothetical protein [Oscillospiraceae bacterium]
MRRETPYETARETIGALVSASPARLLWVLSWQDKKVPPHAVEQTEALYAFSIPSLRFFGRKLPQYDITRSACTER